MRTLFVGVWAALLGSVVGGVVGLKVVEEVRRAMPVAPAAETQYVRDPGPTDLSAALGELPAVELVKIPTPDGTTARPNAYRGTYEFEPRDWFTPHIPVWEKAVGGYKDRPNVRYLEVGVWEGRSAVWMLENVLTGPGSTLTVVDIFYDPAYESRWRSNLKATGQEARTTTIKGPSQTELRKLPIESYDIVYIDGSHVERDVLEDNVQAWRLVKPGGLLINDDYRWNVGLPQDEKPKIAVDVFWRMIGRHHFDVIHNGYQLILRKRPATR